MTESEEAFARRAVRRKGLFLKLSVASLIVAAGLVVLYSISGGGTTATLSGRGRSSFCSSSSTPDRTSVSTGTRVCLSNSCPPKRLRDDDLGCRPNPGGGSGMWRRIGRMAVRVAMPIRNC